MNHRAGRTPKVKEFVQAPFVRCPDCGTDGTFGVLMINKDRYVRRCVNCWFDRVIPLPPIEKRLIYLDQFVISNMMKELDPDRTTTSKGHVDGFYLKLFAKLDRLSKLQLVVSPHSQLQDFESVVDTRYEKIRAVFRQLSHGISFRDPETLLHAEIIRAFDSWLSGEPMDLEVSRDFALTGNPDVWCERFRIDLNSTIPQLAPELIAGNAKIDANLREVCEGWKADPDFTFQRAYGDEVGGHAKNILNQFFTYTGRMTAVQLGQAELTDDLILPPAAVWLVTRMLKRLEETIPDMGQRLQRIGEFFRSEHFRSVPAIRIASLFWASVAREIHGGRNRFPKAGMFNDIRAIAAYSKFCDAMFVDKEISHFASQGELKKELSGRARLYSLREKDAFLAYLTSIEAAASKEHVQLTQEVYGEDWATPFTDLLTTIQKQRVVS